MALTQMISDVDPTAAQVKAARALLGWTQADLATSAGLGASTVADFERGGRDTEQQSLNKIKAALYAAGVKFIANGVLLCLCATCGGPITGWAREQRVFCSMECVPK